MFMHKAATVAASGNMKVTISLTGDSLSRQVRNATQPPTRLPSCSPEMKARRIAANIAKLLSKNGARRIAAPGSKPKFVATVFAPKDANFGVTTRPWYDSH
jgi:hypothetical protein